MIMQIEVEGEILRQEGNKTTVRLNKKNINIGPDAHIWITDGDTIEEFENNCSLNRRNGLFVGNKGGIKLC